jgi:hypothetical protein
MATRSNGSTASSVDVVALCLKYVGVEPTLDPHYKRSQVRLLDRAQARIDKNNAPDHMVKRYAHQMGEGPFPPPLYTEDHVPVDGNTRTKAYALREENYIEAYILPIAWDTADLATKDKLIQLSLAINAKNGLPLDIAEMMKFAEMLIRSGHNDEDIVGNTGLASSKVAMLRAQLRAKDRLANLGHDVKLPDTTLRAFGKPNAMRLDDESYNGLVHLTKDADLKGNQINSLASALNEATSDISRRERLQHERQALQAKITAIQHGQLHPILTDKLRKMFELLSNNPITAFVEGDPERAAEYLDMLDQAITKLAEIQTLQQSQGASAASTQVATTVQ